MINRCASIGKVPPEWITAVHSIDLGSVYTPDGREHPVIGPTIPFLANLSQPTSSSPVDPPTTYPATGPNTPSIGSQFTLANFLGVPQAPSHLGARLVVTIAGLIILTVVLVRLLK